MGVTIREKIKGSGVWWVFIAHDGTRRSKRVGDKKTAKDVAKKLAAKLALGQLNLSDEETCPTFKEYAEYWLVVYVKALRRK